MSPKNSTLSLSLSTLYSTLIFYFFVNRLFIMVTMLFFSVLFSHFSLELVCPLRRKMLFLLSTTRKARDDEEKSPFRLRCAFHFQLPCANVCTCFGKILHIFFHSLTLSLTPSLPLSEVSARCCCVLFLLNKT